MNTNYINQNSALTNQSYNDIFNELKEYATDRINEMKDDISFDFSQMENCELHHEIFNTNYYIIGYYKCEKWLEKHSVNIFDGIKFCQDYERENFGHEDVRSYDNAEMLVNMIVYIIGEEVLNDEFINTLNT
tara:strand:+ start:292 stop:687 length:396 start_codon:yes stop_codon:yes gene_type:complete